ncbi:hypothetical protein LCGC14_1001220 [marine sediment metagenome]|uniref:ISXO2-like transposase domain-containing protein n=1 Tax=marine sediment metagenome TaxID=412755 RepID=A0A0F9QLD9_9ZZZZ
MCQVTISSFEFFKMFPDERSARVHFEGATWPNGPVCPYCEYLDITTLKREGYYRCKSCRKDFTVRVGTVMHRSKIPIRKWLFAMYLVCTARKGVSSVQLSKEIGITQKSAWFLLQRIREGCSKEGEKLSGIVEVDETFIGGLEGNKHKDKKLKAGRGAVGKAAVLGMRERDGEHRVKAFPIADTTSQLLQHSIEKNVNPGATICTDEHGAYRGLRGYDHRVIKHKAGRYVDGMAGTNGIESVWAVLKRGYYGIYHHFSVKHLARYVDEFTFRLNAGNVKIHTMNRINSLIIGMVGKRLTYKALIAEPVPKAG